MVFLGGFYLGPYYLEMSFAQRSHLRGHQHGPRRAAFEGEISRGGMELQRRGPEFALICGDLQEKKLRPEVLVSNAQLSIKQGFVSHPFKKTVRTICKLKKGVSSAPIKRSSSLVVSRSSSVINCSRGCMFIGQNPTPTFRSWTLGKW